MRADARIDQLTDRLGVRRLIWFGIRGEDAVPLIALPQFSHCYSLTAPLSFASLKVNSSLECSTLSRVDLDAYDVDADESENLLDLRREMLTAMQQESFLVSYRPSMFLSAIHFTCRRRCTSLGMFAEQHRVFDHKPWVETELADFGVPTLEWRYVADEDRYDVKRDVELGPVVLRTSTSSGGVGIVLLEDPDLVDRYWPRRRESFVAVTEYLGDALPLNVSGCVFRDGAVTIHPISVQLIGLDVATTRRFGYCGNDFAAARHIPPETIGEIDRIVRRTGAWLHSMRYVGVFGIDLLLEGGRPLLTEINPRFQGSSMLSAEIATRVGVPNLMLDHIAAFLGMASSPGLRLHEWVECQGDVAHLVCHNTSIDSLLRHGETHGPDCRIDLLPGEGVLVKPGATTGRLVFDHAITTTGQDLAAGALEAALQYRKAFETAPSPDKRSGSDGGNE